MLCSTPLCKQLLTAGIMWIVFSCISSSMNHKSTDSLILNILTDSHLAKYESAAALYDCNGLIWTLMVLYGPPMTFYGPPIACYCPPMTFYCPPMAFFVLFIVYFGPSMVHIDPFGSLRVPYCPLFWTIAFYGPPKYQEVTVKSMGIKKT